MLQSPGWQEPAWQTASIIICKNSPELSCYITSGFDAVGFFFLKSFSIHFQQAGADHKAALKWGNAVYCTNQKKRKYRGISSMRCQYAHFSAYCSLACSFSGFSCWESYMNSVDAGLPSLIFSWARNICSMILSLVNSEDFKEYCRVECGLQQVHVHF